jgi:hypothetical protein
MQQALAGFGAALKGLQAGAANLFSGVGAGLAKSLRPAARPALLKGVPLGRLEVPEDVRHRLHEVTLVQVAELLDGAQILLRRPRDRPREAKEAEVVRE